MLRSTLFALTLLFAGSGFAQQSANTDYESKLQQLQKSITALKNELSKVRSNRDKLQSDLQASEVEVGELVKKIEQLKGELANQKKQLTQLNQKQDELQQARKEQQIQIAEQVNSAYRLGQQSQVKLLLNQEQPEKLARVSRYYRYFLDARAEKIETYLDTLAELDTIKPSIEARTQELLVSQQQLEQRHQQLTKAQAEREKTLARLSQSIQRKDEELKQKAQDQQQLEKLIAQVAASITKLALPGDGQPFAKLRGKMPMPAKGKILKQFGSTKIAGKLTWEGILIGAQAGSEVRAIHHGRVVFANYLRGQGLLMILDHGDGYMSLYAHNQALLKEPGDWVNAGELIARVGNSGGQSENALYFEIRHKGRPTNPNHWCRA